MAAGLLVAAGCGGVGRSGEVVVFAAASLRESLGEIAAAFESSPGGAEVVLGVGPSDGLARQIQGGAPADVFAPADPRWMDRVAGDVPVRDRAVLARNELVVAVPEGDPGGIDELRDLTMPGVKVVLAGSSVPAGSYAREALRRAGVLAGVEANVVSNEVDVKGVVQKLLLAEADAGIVYRTDLTEGLEAAALDPPLGIEVSYPVALVGEEASPEAERFLRFLLGDRGRRILVRHGFLPP